MTAPRFDIDMIHPDFGVEGGSPSYAHQIRSNIESLLKIPVAHASSGAQPDPKVWSAYNKSLLEHIEALYPFLDEYIIEQTIIGEVVPLLAEEDPPCDPD